jgi:hypothetical protein
MKPKPKAKVEVLVEKELLERIKATKFAPDGLRVHTAPLSRYEYDFRALPVWEYERVAKYEYKREIQRFYITHKEMVRGDWPALKRKQPSWEYPSPLADECLLFPIPWMELRRIVGPTPPPEPSVGGFTAIHEVDADWLERGIMAEHPDVSFHRLRLDWNKGSKAIQRELLAWTSEMAKAHKRAKNPVDFNLRLQQLAAWRAKRAGMNADDYLQLRLKTFKMGKASDFSKAKLSAYEDPSTFRSACRNVDAILKGLLKE